MPSKPHKAPSKDTARIEASLYQQSDFYLTHDLVNNDRSTAARFIVTGPDGETASAFLSVIYRDGKWFAQVSHDATDFNTDTIAFRHKEIQMRFFGKRS